METKWFREAKFGLFIHWGLYALTAGMWKDKEIEGPSEWNMYYGNIPKDEYRALAKEFNPTEYDAKKVVELAKSLHMKYIVITSKHHDGFAMYDSAVSDYNIVKATPYGKDPIKALAEECKKEGLKFCIYYSHGQDWDDENGYTRGLDDNLEQRTLNFNTYLDEKCLPQLRELLTNYGEIGLIWFDGPLFITPEQSKKVRECVKAIQPDCLINTRIGNCYEDYYSTGDNMIPAIPIESMWEAPGTTNHSWGYKVTDKEWKNPKLLIQNLIKITARGGNYLMNVGPDAKGNIPNQSLEVLDVIAKWMDKNGDSIEGTSRMPIFPYEVENVLFTSKPGKLYVHVLEYRHMVYFIGLNSKIKRVTMLDTGKEIEFEQRISQIESVTRNIFWLPEEYKEELIPVICLDLEDENMEIGLAVK